MGGLSIWHWLVVGVIVMLLFGKGRFSDMMGDVAKGLKSFKAGMADDEDEKRKRFEEEQRRRNEPPRQLPRDQQPIDVTPSREEPTAPPPRDDEAR
jgi:sec-independent protein translocase protein TatA